MKSYNFSPMRSSLATQSTGFHALPSVLSCVHSCIAITAKSSTYLTFADIVPVTFQDMPADVQKRPRVPSASHAEIVQVYIARILQC